MSGHGHSHGGCGGHDHDHDHVTDADRAAAYSLYLKIDTEKVQCLNEADDGSGKLVFKPWDQRMDKEKFVESDCDEELLFNIPFTGSVKLKGIIIIGGEEDTHPNKMRVFKNRPNMTFDDAASKPEQEFELAIDRNGEIEYTTKAARFNQCECISLHFPSNFGGETSKVYYIGLKGDFTQAHRHEVTICTYESSPNVADHKTNLFDSVNQQIH